MLTIIYVKSEQIYRVNNLRILVIDSRIDNLIKNVYAIYMLKYLCINKFSLYLEYAIRNY